MKVASRGAAAKDAVRYLVLVREITGPEWLTPALFRIGASSLLDDLLMQRRKQLTGVYPARTTSRWTDPGLVQRGSPGR